MFDSDKKITIVTLNYYIIVKKIIQLQ